MRSLCAAVFCVIVAGIPAAADWPQFLGPERNGVYRGPALAETWPAQGPRVAWRKTVGQGFAAPVVVQNRLILFHRVGAQEVVEALDATTGASVWRYQYPTTYRDDFGFDEGPRAVPVVADGIVYTFGAEGQLHAVNLATGQRVWSEDTMKRFNVPKGFFGAAGSPLVEGGRVIANVGGPKAGHRRVRREDRPGAVDRDHGSGELLVGRGGDVPVRQARDLPHARRARRPRSGDRHRSPFAATGGRGPTRRSTSRRRWSSAI